MDARQVREDLAGPCPAVLGHALPLRAAASSSYGNGRETGLYARSPPGDPGPAPGVPRWGALSGRGVRLRPGFPRGSGEITSFDPP